ncbi:unnamed protein product [Cuscuta europaea]|uniref:Interactor of constitutive active ROPs 4-like n=1 Tax=Cuscuta europaea TaxID=41803 RepID=A0A9P0ZLY2_CUSEU|nr:unnamed protein product [Cuscuta europaea]
MPQRNPLGVSSQLRVSCSDAEQLRGRPLTERSPRLLGDRPSPRGSRSDPTAQKKLGLRISYLENQLGLAQEELKCLKEQLTSTEIAKKLVQEKVKKKTMKPAVPKQNFPDNEKENRHASEVFDDSSKEFDEVSMLRAELEEKEKELANVYRENESLKQQMNEEAMEASLAKKKEEETTLHLKQVKEELETSRNNAVMLSEKLVDSEKTKEALEAEVKKLSIQTEQWMKAADAAASLLSGDQEIMMNGRRMSERYRKSVLEPVARGYVGHPVLFHDSEDASESGRKKGSGIKIFGDLWRKKSQK